MRYAILAAGLLSLPAFGQDKPPPPATACHARGTLPVVCFVDATVSALTVCSLSIKLYNKPSTYCSAIGLFGHMDYYEGALKQFDGNAAAQSMTKDYFALWQASMDSLLTGSRSQHDRIQYELGQKANRLKLER